MPQFQAGAEKVAKATMRNPTAKAFGYDGVLYMGTDLAVMAEVPFSLDAGQEEEISFPVTMPSAPGVYPVHIGVFSGGRNIALYKAEEDVEIVANYFEYAYCDSFRRVTSPTGWPADIVAFNWKAVTQQYPVTHLRATFSVFGTQWRTLFSGAFYGGNEGRFSDYCTFNADTAGITTSGRYAYTVAMDAYHWTGTQNILLCSVFREGEIDYVRD